MIYLQLDWGLQELSPMYCWPAAASEGNSATGDRKLKDLRAKEFHFLMVWLRKCPCISNCLALNETLLSVNLRFFSCLPGWLGLWPIGPLSPRGNGPSAQAAQRPGISELSFFLAVPLRTAGMQRVWRRGGVSQRDFRGKGSRESGPETKLRVQL